MNKTYIHAPVWVLQGSTQLPGNKKLPGPGPISIGVWAAFFCLRGFSSGTPVNFHSSITSTLSARQCVCVCVFVCVFWWIADLSGVYSCLEPCDCAGMGSSLWLDWWSNRVINTWQWPHPVILQLPLFSLSLLVPSDFSLVSPTFVVKQSGAIISGSVMHWHIYVCGGVWGQISHFASQSSEWSRQQLFAGLWSCTHFNTLDSFGNGGT